MQFFEVDKISFLLKTSILSGLNIEIFADFPTSISKLSIPNIIFPLVKNCIVFSIGKKNCIYSLNDEMTFILMFSFESFHYFHKCLKELERNNVISDETFDEIIKNLQKK